MRWLHFQGARRLQGVFSPKASGLGLGQALMAEMLGTILLQFLGGLSGGAVGNGLALAAASYLAIHVSGGCLNPAIVAAQAASGHMHWVAALLFSVAQLLGAIGGAVVSRLLVPHHTDCPEFGRLSGGQVFGWELMATFLLVSAYYAVVTAHPSHGSLAPLAMGLTLWGAMAAAEEGGRNHGLSANPCRLLGGALVSGCRGGGRRALPSYLAGQLAGALLAALVYAMPFLGVGTAYHWDRPSPRAEVAFAEEGPSSEPFLPSEVGIPSDAAAAPETRRLLAAHAYAGCPIIFPTADDMALAEPLRGA